MIKTHAAAVSLMAGALALGGCEFSAGVGDRASQQRDVRALAEAATAAANPCVDGWIRQSEVTAAFAGGTGDEAGVTRAIEQAETACRTASRHMQDARPPAILNSANKELMRTALLACQTAYADAASEMALRPQQMRAPGGTSSATFETAIRRTVASMDSCRTSWAAAMAPLELSSVLLPTLMAQAPAATDMSAPASAEAPAVEGALIPTPAGEAGQYGKIPPGGEAPPPEPEAGGEPASGGK